MTEKISISNSRGDQLAARLERPDSGNARGVVVFAHCFTCGKDLKAAREISRGVLTSGWAMMRFDFTGLGESEGEFADSTFSANVDDLVSAVHSVAASLELPVVLVGHSLGAAAALLATRECPEVRAVATIGAPADPSHVTQLLSCGLDEVKANGEGTVKIAGREFRIRRDFIDALEAPNMKAVVGEMKRPVLFFHSPVDQTVGIENAASLFGYARHPKSFVSLDTADHLLTKRDDARYVAGILSAWVGRYAFSDS